MKNNCSKYKDALLEAALTDDITSELHEHLPACTACARKLALLQARRKRMDEILPLLANQKGPSPEFRARVLAAAEAQSSRRSVLRRAWLFAAATVIAVVVVVVIVRRPTASGPSQAELAAGQKFSQWRAPSDTLLVVPGQEVLRTVPKLGESFMKSSYAKSMKEE